MMKWRDVRANGRLVFGNLIDARTMKLGAARKIESLPKISIRTFRELLTGRCARICRSSIAKFTKQNKPTRVVRGLDERGSLTVALQQQPSSLKN